MLAFSNLIFIFFHFLNLPQKAISDFILKLVYTKIYTKREILLIVKILNLSIKKVKKTILSL